MLCCKSGLAIAVAGALEKHGMKQVSRSNLELSDSEGRRRGEVGPVEVVSKMS